MSDWRVDFTRLRTALFCGEPDCVPLAELKVDPVVKAAFMGRERWPTERQAAMEAEIAFAKAAGYDYIRATAHVNYPLTGETKVHAYARSGLSMQQRTWQQASSGGLIRTMADCEGFSWPDPGQADLEELYLAAELAPPEMGIITSVKGGGIFERAWFLMGFDGFMLATVEQPELVAEVMRRTGEVWVRTIERCLREAPRVDAVWFCDDLAYTESFIVNPGIYRQHLFPWIEQLGAICHAQEPPIPLIYHSDGKLWEVLDDLIACGINALHPIEPKAMDIVKLKRHVQGKLCLIGNIDLGYTLTRGTPTEVETEVRERIAALAPGGGYCVGSSNTVTEYVPVENFRAMVEATRRYG
ncbi:MAG: uroporphyrinogen decarboxylase family protein [Candidatus Zipacnadales bacterium]